MSNNEKVFLRIFQRLSRRHSPWNVWRGFIFTSATAISNRVDKRVDVWRKRENKYLSVIKQYDKDERLDIPVLLAYVTKSLQESPAQDFLGRMFMTLELSNHWQGQFFTPYHLSELMAEISVGGNIEERVRQSGYISVSDPACGAGSLIIAFANVCAKHGVDYQNSVLFAGQDVDETAALMCYIQMSLLGCGGYVAVGNSLTEPVKGTPLRPVYKRENLWFTPGYLSQPWVGRWMGGKHELQKT